ncbi:hypothetical protein VPH35_125895 [Triticum aestivum]|uniref:Uncharacterized protein n=1 Tax=Triticum urartu TaxID=4572 RepID=A0A8R7VJT2_TRIUA
MVSTVQDLRSMVLDRFSLLRLEHDQGTTPSSLKPTSLALHLIHPSQVAQLITYSYLPMHLGSCERKLFIHQTGFIASPILAVPSPIPTALLLLIAGMCMAPCQYATTILVSV